MKYLFFDLECSNTFKGEGKICEFGYVLTDENFNELQKRNIVMSPGPRRIHDWTFDNSRTRCEKGFERWFDPIEYYSSNEFPYYHKFIYELLTDKDTLVFGFAVDNDIRYIDYTCSRYNLEKPKYLAIDIKVIADAYREIYKDDKYKGGLDDCFKRFYSVNEFIRLQAHKAKDDAFMTMKVMQALCKLYKKNVYELIEFYPTCKLDSIKYVQDWKAKQIRREQQKQERLKCISAWGEFLLTYSNLTPTNQTIYISSEFKKNISLFNKALTFIKENNYFPVNKLFKSNFLLVVNNVDKERLLKAFQEPYTGKIIVLSEFNKTI